MFHALEPEPQGFIAHMKEEITVTRRTRMFMAEYHEALLDGVHVTGQAIEREMAGVPATPDLIQQQDSAFRRLLAALHVTKHRDEQIQAELAAARGSILGAA